jgi:hypothetical protein
MGDLWTAVGAIASALVVLVTFAVAIARHLSLRRDYQTLRRERDALLAKVAALENQVRTQPPAPLLNYPRVR